MFDIQFFPQWPYDHALSWMKEAHQRILREPSLIILGVGSHQESVITLGKNPAMSIIHSEKLGNEDPVMIRHIDRGGGATVHEPGQIVLYPILNSKFHRLSPKDLTLILEKTMINFLARFGVLGRRGEGSPGVFIGSQKVGFVGLRIREDISSHGMALNVFNDCRLFGAIDPCGIAGLAVSSLYRHVDLEGGLEDLLGWMAEEFKANLMSHIFCLTDENSSFRA